jgi:hypothetical protein
MGFFFVIIVQNLILMKEFLNNYSQYFVDFWQYLVIIVIMILAAIFIL